MTGSMTEGAPRSLEARLTDYRDGLLEMANGVEKLLDSLPSARGLAQVEARAGLRANITVWRITASEDLTQLLAGDELPKFVLITEIPNG